MTSQEKRKAVAAKYATIIGRNYYNQDLRDYCFIKYKDGNYYSDCSSSICYAYQEAGLGFGILNTAGIYQSEKLSTVDLTITEGVPDLSKLRVGDLLEFAGDDSSRPLKIGHVEMVYNIAGGKATLCGHGSGRPSFKDMEGYCKSRYSQIAEGGWRKGVACVKRYIGDDGKQTALPLPQPTEPVNLSGWKKESNGWRFYLGDTGDWVKNSWYQDSDEKWYWFDGSGIMVINTWYQYQGSWYYLGSDGAMVKGLQAIDGKWYYMEKDGKMASQPVTLTPDQNGALKYPTIV